MTELTQSPSHMVEETLQLSKPLRFYVEQFGVCKRTICRWRQAGLPLDQPLELLKAIGKRKNVPEGLRTILGRLGKGGA